MVSEGPDATTGSRAWAGKLGVLTGSLLVLLALAEAGLRTVSESASTASDEWPVMTRHDPLLGWSLKPNATGTARTAEFEATERTNAFGVRGDELTVPKPPQERRVLLLGDSFGEGYTVNQDETLDVVLEREIGVPDLRVVNGSTRGWSTDQELLWFLSRGDAVEPEATVLLFYLNDVCFNARDRYWRGFKPRFVLEGDSLAIEGVPVPPPSPSSAPARSESGLRGLLRNSAIYGLVRDALRRPRMDEVRIPPERAPWSKRLDAHPCLVPGWEMTERLMARFRDEVERRGGRFLIFWVPSKWAVYDAEWERLRSDFGIDPSGWDPSTDAERLRDICRRNRIECVIPRERFRAVARESDTRLYYVKDAHWTPAGHALAARVLAERLRGALAPPEPCERWP